MKSDIVVEQTNGKRTGFGLVFLPDEKRAMEAKAKLDKQRIKNRYIDILLCTSADIIA